jgi:hypothetical protein
MDVNILRKDFWKITKFWWAKESAEYRGRSKMLQFAILPLFGIGFTDCALNSPSYIIHFNMIPSYVFYQIIAKLAWAFESARV